MTFPTKSFNIFFFLFIFLNFCLAIRCKIVSSPNIKLEPLSTKILNILWNYFYKVIIIGGFPSIYILTYIFGSLLHYSFVKLWVMQYHNFMHEISIQIWVDVTPRNYNDLLLLHFQSKFLPINIVLSYKMRLRVFNYLCYVNFILISQFGFALFLNRYKSTLIAEIIFNQFAHRF